MGAWYFVEPDLDWVLEQIEARHRAALCRPPRPADRGRSASQHARARASDERRSHLRRSVQVADPRRDADASAADTLRHDVDGDHGRHRRSDARRVGHRGDDRQVAQAGRRGGRGRRAARRARDRQGHRRGAGAGRGRARARSPPRTARRRGRRGDRPDRGRRRRRASAGAGRQAGPATAAPRRRRGGARRGHAPPKCRCRRRVRKLAAETRHRSRDRAGTGKAGRVTKGDMLAAIERAGRGADAGRAAGAHAVQVRAPSPPDDAAREERVPMTRLRQTHRAPARRGAAHRRDAHDVQRGRHDRGDGAAQQVQGRVREEARREARLHVVLRARPASRR